MLYLFARISCLILTLNTVIIAKDVTPAKKKEPKLKDYDWTVWCKFQPNGFDCGKRGASRFYYDMKMQGCKTFTHGGCPTSFNNFGTLTECNEMCFDPGQHLIKQNITDKVLCRLQPDFGQCDGYHPMWYFDINHRVCRGFSYSGCGGNYNRFTNAQVCTAVCGRIVEF